MRFALFISSLHYYSQKEKRGGERIDKDGWLARRYAEQQQYMYHEYLLLDSN
jgi:hypothetical protein